MTLEAYLFLANSDTVLLAFIALLSLYNFSKSKKEIKLIGLIALAGSAANGITIVFANLRLTALMNIPATVYDFVFILLVSALYDHQTNRKYVLLFRVTGVTGALVVLTNLIFFQQQEISSYSKLLSALLVITYAVIYFYRLMIDLPTHEVHKLPMFWFNSGFLIYHAGTIFLFAFTSYLVHVLKDNLLIYYSFHNVLSLVKNVILLVGVLYNIKAGRTAMA
jgi:hypothetical protein